MIERAAAVLVIGALLLPGGTFAQEAEPDTTQAEGRHEVRKGDTLWDLARAYLEDPFNWPEIYEANRDRIEDPHWIYPGQMLLIPPGMERAEVAEVEVKAPGEAREPEPAEEPESGRRTVFYPEDTGDEQRGPTVVGAGAGGRTPVPLHEHHAASWLPVDGGDPYMGTVVRVLGTKREGKHPPTALPYYKVRLHYTGSPAPAVGDRLLAVAEERDVQGYGRVRGPTGIVTVERVEGDVIVGSITGEFGPLRAGDGLLPLGDFTPIEDPEYREVADGLEGRIISFRLERELPGRGDEVYLSVGSEEGVGVGDEFVVVDPSSPTGSEVAAQLRVLRVTSGTATARLDRIYSPDVAPGLPVRLVRTVR